MTNENRIVHILDDLAMGGVTRALKNFEHPDLAGLGTHDIVDIRQSQIRATSPGDIAIVHFTANWKKLRWLADLRLLGGFARIIMIEHTYTAGYEDSEVKPKRRFRQMLKFAYSLVDTVVAVSHAQRSWMYEHKLAPIDKIIAIPQSRICDALLEIPPVHRSMGPLQIRAFGRFHKQKGFDLLLAAMSRIPPHLAELKLAGTGPDEASLRGLAERCPNVEICQPFESPDTFLSEADIVAIPSRWEAFGLVGTEARAAGRPIIAANVDGLRDQLTSHGFSHAPGSVSSIVRAIYKAAAAPNLQEYGSLAQAIAVQEYPSMIARWADLLSADGRQTAKPKQPVPAPIF